MRRLANPGWNGLMKDIHTGLILEDGRIRPLGGTLTETDAGITPVTSSGNYAGENAEPLSGYLREMERGEVPVGSVRSISWEPSPDPGPLGSRMTRM